MFLFFRVWFSGRNGDKEFGGFLLLLLKERGFQFHYIGLA